MSKRLHMDQAAEREANEIAFRFMDSSDVVGDMSRAYGADLGSVRLHTDEAAARKVEGTGADAFSTGKDVFFGRGVFNRSDPASRGLLAHELAHSLQQGVGDGTEGAVEQSTPEGAAQGGLIDWFRGLFGKKKPEPEPEEDLEISEPELVPDGPMNVSLRNDNGDTTVREFLSQRSYALHQMVRGASREQMQDPMLRQLVLDDYNTNMNARLRGLNGKGKLAMDASFRGGAGELSTLNMMMASFAPEDFSQQVMAAQKEGGVDGALNFMSDFMEGNQGLMDFLGGTDASFQGVDYYENPEERSATMMNNFMLRMVNSKISQDLGARERAAHAAGTGPVDTSDLKRAMMLQKELNKGEGASSRRMRGVLARMFGRH